MYRNTKNVPYYVFGQGSLAQLADLLKPRREAKWTARSSSSWTIFFAIMN